MTDKQIMAALYRHIAKVGHWLPGQQFTEIPELAEFARDHTCNIQEVWFDAVKAGIFARPKPGGYMNGWILGPNKNQIVKYKCLEEDPE